MHPAVRRVYDVFKRHRCSRCGRTFHTKQGLAAHNSSVHADEETKPSVADTRAARALGLHGSSPPVAVSDPDSPPFSPLGLNADEAGFFFNDDAEVRASRQPRVEEVEDEYFTERFPGPAGVAGEKQPLPFELWREQQIALGVNPFSPFEDAAETDFAEWLIKSGLGHGDIDDLLSLDKIREHVPLSFHNKRSFLQKVDALPSGAPWQVQLIQVTGDRVDANNKTLTEDLELWYRNPVDVVKELLGNPLFRDLLVYSPVRTWVNELGKTRCISEMWTADWWWELQSRLPEGVTIAPLILASDKTQLSNFSGDKQAYPVYLTIGNFPKATRRQPSSGSVVLLGYLPVSKLEIFTPETRSRAAHRLFHRCMSCILEPLHQAGKEGVDVLCADGAMRRVFMILAAYIGDYPERCLVAGCRSNQCPVCVCPPAESGTPGSWAYRTRVSVLNALRLGPTHPSHKGLGLTDIVSPFWADLPHSDIFRAFPPDVLHQLHKGVFGDHLLQWCVSIVGKEEVDRRLKAMPLHPAMRHFKKGIGMISQWTGTEYRHTEKQILGVVAGYPDKRLGLVVRALLDFIYCARLPAHSDDTLAFMKDAYDRFHEHKQIFLATGVRTHFNIPKLHSMSHYISAIRWLGSADGFDTEGPERLHIDFCKEAYRASNRRDYIAQMVTWLRRREAMDKFMVYLRWSQGQSLPSRPPSVLTDSDSAELESTSSLSGHLNSQNSIAFDFPRAPSFQLQPVSAIVQQHFAPDFLSCTEEFIRSNIGPRDYSMDPLARFDVFKRFSIVTTVDGEITCRDVIRATPEPPRTRSNPRLAPHPAYFDTALISADPEHVGKPVVFKDMQAVRLRVIFTLPSHFGYPHHLAYVEFFNPFRVNRAADTGLLVTSRSTRAGQVRAGVIRVDRILRSCHLFPQFPTDAPYAWTAVDSLDKCKLVYLNEFVDEATYAIA